MVSGDYLIKSDISSPVSVQNAPTPMAPPPDATSRNIELEKGMAPQTNTRQNTPSITLGTMNG